MINRRVADGLNLFNKLTLRRVFNAIQVWSSYHLAKLLSKPIHWGDPISISIEPTTSCNLRCPECPSGLRSFSRPIGMLQDDLFEKAIEELSQRTIYLLLYFQGEPYLNRNFIRYVNLAHRRNLYVATSTNAHYLNNEMARITVESGLDRLIISIDGTTQESYEKYRIGGHLDHVLEGTRNIVKWKHALCSAKPHLIFQMVVFSSNEHQIKDLYTLAKTIGVDEVRLKTAQVNDFVNGSPLLPKQQQYSRYRKNSDEEYVLKNKLKNQCWRLWSSAVITWDGAVVPCCFDKDALHPMGNIQASSFRKVWRNQTYRNFRSALLQSRSEIEICKNCSEGTQVWK